MHTYQRATGLKPVGPHRPGADKLLKEVSHRCLHCGGQGYVEIRSAWIWCEVCGGARALYDAEGAAAVAGSDGREIPRRWGEGADVGASMKRGSRRVKTLPPTAAEIERLLAFRPRLTADGFTPIRRSGGGEKTEDGSFVMPWPMYDEVVKEFLNEGIEGILERCRLRARSSGMGDVERGRRAQRHPRSDQDDADVLRARRAVR